MIISLDTNIVIEVLNSNAKTLKFLSSFNTITIPVIVQGELLFGAKNSGNPTKNLIRLERVLKDYPKLEIFDDVSEQYAIIRKQLKDDGRPIPENDIWIAATCIVHNIPLLTRDKHFDYIHGLERFI